MVKTGLVVSIAGLILSFSEQAYASSSSYFYNQSLIKENC